MHSGHYNAIRQAKSTCDTLVVGIHSDAEIEEHKALPVMNQSERYALLDHIKWIDEIVYDVPYSPQLATLERAKADFCVHGDDMPVNSQGVCAYDEMKLAGKLRIIKRTEGVSTTDIIGRLLTLASAPHDATIEGNKDLMGRKLSGDAVLDRLMPGPDIAYDKVNALIAKYNMSSEDAKVLRESVKCLYGLPSLSDTRALSDASTCESTDSAVQEEEDAQHAESTKTAAGLRTSAPVQILTTTRRIAEFASSRQPDVGDRVVYVSGSFDMFHVGHAQFLKDARALGTFLLVGIHDDNTVRCSKGPSHPVMNISERVLNVSACKWVDEVIIGAPRIVTEDLIKTFDIRVVASGVGQRTNADVENTKADPFLIPKQQGIFAEVTSKWPELCHNTIVQRVISSRELYMKRNEDRARREDAYYEQKSHTALPKET
jgi:ethanolamine-phosphate cytidylyltransferase